MSTEKAHLVCDIPLMGVGHTVDDAIADLARNFRRDHPESIGSISTVQLEGQTRRRVASDQVSTTWTARATLHTTREVDL